MALKQNKDKDFLSPGFNIIFIVGLRSPLVWSSSPTDVCMSRFSAARVYSYLPSCSTVENKASHILHSTRTGCCSTLQRKVTYKHTQDIQAAEHQGELPSHWNLPTQAWDVIIIMCQHTALSAMWVHGRHAVSPVLLKVDGGDEGHNLETARCWDQKSRVPSPASVPVLVNSHKSRACLQMSKEI